MKKIRLNNFCGRISVPEDDAAFAPIVAAFKNSKSKPSKLQKIKDNALEQAKYNFREVERYEKFDRENPGVLKGSIEFNRFLIWLYLLSWVSGKELTDM
jgi:hypothetical protein